MMYKLNSVEILTNCSELVEAAEFDADILCLIHVINDI